VHTFHEGNHILEAIGKVASAAFVAAGASAGALSEDVALGGSDVTGQVAERELTLAASPLDLVGRDAADEAHSPFSHLLEIVQKLFAVHNSILPAFEFAVIDRQDDDTRLDRNPAIICCLEY
jgi:hypothetical protein